MMTITELAQLLYEHENPSVPWDNLDDSIQKQYKTKTLLFQKAVLENFKGNIIYFRDEGYDAIAQEQWLGQINYFLEKIGKKNTGQLNIYQIFRCIEEAIQRSSSEERKALAKLKYFQDNILTYLRAIALVADGCSTRGLTHREKDERYKLLISSIESAIQKVVDGYDDLLTRHWYSKPDLFRSDYPVLRYLEKIKELETEISKLKNPETQNTQSYARAEFDSAEF